METTLNLPAQAQPREERHAAFNQCIRGCNRCFSPEAHKFTDTPIYRRNFKLCIIGHSPSLYRTKAGFCFGGKARDVFAEILRSLEVYRNEAYITNAIKCTIPQKETGRIENCLPWLNQELAILQPKQVLVFGREPVDHLLGQGVSLNGEATRRGPIQFFTLPHPMTVLYKPDTRRQYFTLVDKVAKAIQVGAKQTSLGEF